MGTLINTLINKFVMDSLLNLLLKWVIRLALRKFKWKNNSFCPFSIIELKMVVGLNEFDISLNVLFIMAIGPILDVSGLDNVLANDLN